MPAEVIMYATRFCPYCMRARSLLKKKGVEYTEISVGRDRDLWDEMEQRSGRNTVPQIFINDESVGGYDDIAALDRQGELDQKLGIEQDG
ncbi:glutaredoxin 3 [Cocleimonas flava]|uniref:Glutaredoxin n=2 Tax=Cocleimonas TaxID=998014 RepID=A0A4R1ESS1_9GAMM|nr:MULTISPECIES: glutaredoxin 3 [Cocleimonas]MEB8432528.1 glutaredoxin 3 [Cocleimonas sp. KMM 6892]MEC4715387.1 glutaredoxin 3 [Cocleimonas sp. KMM 6895]TCJ82962.1 glutaredoxin 3 [Cocleimonas flava]